ncbi:MAG: MBL fold metallo-hydrolase [Candidatus Brocadiia bacterium]
MARLQIDMLPVGDSDALLVEVDTSGAPVVILVDGGRNWEDGQRILDQLDRFYGGRIDHLVLSHIDGDHAAGLLHVVECLGPEQIGAAWVYDLRRHGVDPERAVTIAERTRDGARSTAVRSVAEHLRRSVEVTHRLVRQLEAKGVPVQEAFADGKAHIGPMQVLAPTQGFFQQCVHFFDDIELMHETVEAGVSFRRRKAPGKGPAAPEEVLDSAVDDPESDKQASLVLRLDYDGDRYLFTGDAGRRALRKVDDQSEVADLHWLKVPNHGSKHNLDSALLDLMSPRLAYISSSGIGLNPHPALLDALQQRGAAVYTTAGSGNVWHRRGDVPSREGYETKRPR